MEDLNILLAGNPNAGKSTLFNRLTGGHAKVGNWHGVTVGVTKGRATLGGRRCTVCDLPGICAVEAMSLEEKLARDYVLAHAEDALLFVAECASLERALPLLYALTPAPRRVALVLTKRKRFVREGGRVDLAGLAARLGIPVLDGERRGLKGEIAAALDRQRRPRSATLEGVYVPARTGLTRLDRLLLFAPLSLPLFALILLSAFLLTFAPGLLGDRLKEGVEGFFSGTLYELAAGISSPLVRSFVQDGLLRALGGVLCFLPQIAILYLVLILLEESGYLSRLAALTDAFLSKFGMNGRAVFSLLMGFGCTAAAILSTRGLEDRRIQRRAILCLPYLACSAKMPVFLTLAASFSARPFLAVAGLYALGVLFALLLSRAMRGKAPPLILELAPLQLPRPLFVLRSLLFQLKQFIIKVATVILAFFVASWLLSSFDITLRPCAVEESVLAKLCGALRFLFAPAGMNDWRIAYAALSGLVAKENVAGALAMFYGGFPFSAASGMAFAVFLITCSPCVSAIAATARELGWRRALLYAALQTGSALLLCYFTYFCMRGGIVLLPVALLPLVACHLVRKEFGTLHRNRKKHAQGVHR